MLTYIIQFTEEELNQLTGDLYYYFRSLLDESNKYLEDNSILNEDKEWYKKKLKKTTTLVQKLDTINNQIPTPDQVFVLKDIKGI